jgi:N-formylglutamate amidohydrolase
MQYKRIVINEPHASIEGLYDEHLSFWNIDEKFVNDIVLKWTDWHTDFLFHGYKGESVRTVRFPYSRFIVDAERLWDDPLDKQGQGIVYTKFDSYERTIPFDNHNYLLSLWHSHQANLRNNLCADALLLDCHSFPSELSDVDICIGYNEDWSKPNKETLELAINLFEDYGYKVGINEPYSNSETPDCPFCYKSMMLEVNKGAYMDEGSLRLRHDHIYKKSIRELMSRLLTELII